MSENLRDSAGIQFPEIESRGILYLQIQLPPFHFVQMLQPLFLPCLPVPVHVW